MTGEIEGTSQLCIDFNSHLHPLDPEEKQYVRRRVEEESGEPIFRDIDSLRDIHTKAGVDGGVVSSQFYMGHEDVGRVRKANNKLLEEIKGYERYYGLAAIPGAVDGDIAASEFKRCLDNGFNGGGIKTESNGIELHDPELEPVFEVADQTGAPILVKPKIHDSLRSPTLDDSWQLNAIFGREAAIAASICQVIHEGVLDRFENLNLVFHHSGGNIAGMMDRIELKLYDGSWYRSDQVKPFDEFKTQLEERIYLDSSGYFGSPRVFRATLEEFPSSQFLFGTDYPFETRSPETFQKLINSIEDVTSGIDAKQILGQNALNLLVNK